MPSPASIENEESEPKDNPSRFNRWIVQPIVGQLKQGTSPEKISWSIALGITLGIFPIMGTTSFLGLIVAWMFKLNQPVLHLFNAIVYPLHLALILVFIRLGQELHGVDHIQFSISEMLEQFKNDPAQFARDFGIAALHGIEAWAITTIILTPLIYFVSLPLLRKLMTRSTPTT